MVVNNHIFSESRFGTAPRGERIKPGGGERKGPVILFKQSSDINKSSTCFWLWPVDFGLGETGQKPKMNESWFHFVQCLQQENSPIEKTENVQH